MTNLSEAELASLYDKQIEALLVDDYETFKGLVTNLNKNIFSHKSAWGNTPFEELSLFADLPGCDYCASQIEWRGDLSYREQEVKDNVLLGATLSLPNLDMDGPMSEKEIAAYRFSREELEEFKRRQLVARFPKPHERSKAHE